MLFSTPLFCFAFLPVFFLLYALPGPKRLLLLAGSLLFYAWGEPVFVCVILASSLLDWVLGKGILRFSGGTLSTVLLGIGVVGNLGLLAYTKYAAFAVSNWNFLMDLVAQPMVAVPAVALPIGVSFIVFEKITYLVDIRRGLTPPAKSLVDYLNYVFLFPKLLAGPIVKYHDIADQLGRPLPAWEGFRDGLTRFVFGLGKKLLIADQLGGFADRIFALEPGQVDAGTAWLGILAFGFQIYFDFAGYSDMAIGMGRMLGFRFLENFNNPYLATSVGDFWKRWHISLTSWIKEYVYIPLGGNRLPGWRVAGNLMICFVLSGLWHGASWNFVIWGVLHGAGIAADKCFWQHHNPKIPVFLRWLGTALFVFLCWVFFRIEQFGQAAGFLSSAFGHPASVPNDIFLTPEILTVFALAAGLVGVPLLGSRLKGWTEDAMRTGRLAMAVVVIVVCAGRMSLGNVLPFIYFRF